MPEPPGNDSLTAAEEPRKEPPPPINPLAWTALFGVLYFIQSTSEVDGLAAQPINSLLKSWGYGAADIAGVTALLWLPWAIKPLYGLLSDFVPLAGYHRKSYLVATSAVTAGCLLATGGWLAGVPEGEQKSLGTLLALLVPATIGVAFGDVVVDALMIAKGQPHGLTGRFQSAQWGALYGATVLTASLGGWFCQHKLEYAAFLICGALSLVTVVLCAGVISEPRAVPREHSVRASLNLLRRAATSRTVVAVGLFMFCWNFNPFFYTILYLRMTTQLHFSEQFYGNMMSLHWLAAMTGSLLYGLYCRRVPMRLLVHASIVLGIGANLSYWALGGEFSARAIAMVAGFATATATVIQLDLAAQVCPTETAGTLFATLMGLSNLGTALSIGLGGWLYQRWQASWSDLAAFNMLVGLGAAFTAGCWLIVPLLKPALVNHRR